MPAKDTPIISVSPKVYNFGTVSQSNGIVEGFVDISNIGVKDLILKDMETSCMCTEVSVIEKNGKEGPKFGMRVHGTNPTNWQEVIPPGESLKLKIYYDPNAHKDLLGYVSRTISIYSNDPKQKNIEVRTQLNQIR